MKEVAKEFKQFIMRGNVIDMAVGIIIGAAFTKIVNSMVADILMPPLGLLMGKVDFSNWFVVLKPGTDGVRTFATMADAQAAGATTMNLGLFLNAIISFVIVAFCVFLLIKAINKLNKPAPAPAAEPTTKKCPFCCSEIALEATRCPHCTSEIK